MKKNIRFAFFVTFIFLGIILSVTLTSAVINGSTVTSNASNGTSWFRGGSNQSFNYSLMITQQNSSTNITQINFSVGTGFTLWGPNVVLNNSAWVCSLTNSTYGNCSGGSMEISPNVTLTLNMTLNSSALEQNHSITFVFRDNFTSTSTNVSYIQVDGIVPNISMPSYTNGTAKKNTAQLTFNVSLGENGSGGSQCWLDINGTNQSFSVSSGWCNGTVGNLTGLSDGNRSISIFANDSVGNNNITTIYYVQVDTTNPSPAPLCSPSTVTQGAAFPCSCSATDATSGVSSSSGSSSSEDGTSSPQTTGTHTYTCSATDYAGNSVSSAITYTVQGLSSSSSGGGSTTTWTTQTITEEIFEKGYTTNLGSNNRVKIDVEGQAHHVGVVSITSNEATIEIASDPVRVTLSSGEDAKADLNNDGYYDVRVLLNSITAGKANLTISKINEAIPEEKEGNPVETTGEIEKTDSDSSSENKTWLWILIAVVIILILFGKKALRNRSY